MGVDVSRSLGPKLGFQRGGSLGTRKGAVPTWAVNCLITIDDIKSFVLSTYEV